MTRLFSFLAAIIVFASASAEIASFVIDHRSWIERNVSVARDYIQTMVSQPATPPRQACDADCAPGPAPQPAAAPRCQDIEQMGKKILCHITLPTPATVCQKDCAEKGKPPLPGNWIRPERQDKSSMASAAPFK